MIPGQQTMVLPQHLYDQIVAEARAGKPEEICGIVRGRGNHVFEAIPARNIAEERIENYTVDPQTLLRQFDFEDAGDEMAAIYHSHPVSVAYPSATDAWNAHYPESVYLICSLEFDDEPVVRGWRLVAEDVAVDWDEVKRVLPFVEVRRGLFGFFQSETRAVPGVPSAAADEVQPPFYLVYAQDAGEVLDARFVSVRECAIVVGA